MPYTLRVATDADRPVLAALIARSARTLGAADYAPEQIEGALQGAFGVDSQLIRDRTYFVVTAASDAVACGGWSYRRTLFGSDQSADRDAAALDPVVDAAKIRAFFVDPAHARHGLGTLLLEHCEAAAATAGFRACELMATLPGVRLYAARGYVAGTPMRHPLAEGLDIEFVPMRKELAR